MLLTRRKQDPAAPQLNMAAMVDVVFLLLIFFMCTSSLSQLENNLPAQLSHVGTGKDADSEDFPPIYVRLQTVSDGVLVTCEDEPCATFESLVEKLRKWRASEDIPVIIQGQGAVPFGYMVAALDACYQADFQRVAFSARGGTI